MSLAVWWNHICPGQARPPQWPTRVSRQDEPIRARKAAGLCVQDGRLRFCGFTLGGTYGADAVASHENVLLGGDGGKPHTSPDPTGRCRLCGFYALSEFNTPAKVVLDVELFGTVVVHQKGWRASRQRVLVCWLHPQCACGREAVGVGVVGSLEPRCRVHPICGTCAWSLMSLVDVAGELGCEVRWKPTGGLPPVSARQGGNYGQA